MRPSRSPLLPVPRQLDLLVETKRLRLSSYERCEVVALLAVLLIEASGMVISEATDDRG